jgi:acyl carrier protein
VNETRDKLLAFINDELLADPNRRANPDTALFEDGWIDSLKILRLIAYVEILIDRTIPDEEVVMKHFRTVNTIAEHFRPR